MLRILLLATVICATTQAQAGKCNEPITEEFATFLEHFAIDKQFAVSRTIYPLRGRRWEIGIDEKGNAASKAVRADISQDQNAKAPTLSEYIKKNSLVSQTKKVMAKLAIVEVLIDSAI